MKTQHLYTMKALKRIYKIYGQNQVAYLLRKVNISLFDAFLASPKARKASKMSAFSTIGPPELTARSTTNTTTGGKTASMNSMLIPARNGSFIRPRRIRSWAFMASLQPMDVTSAT